MNDTCNHTKIFRENICPNAKEMENDSGLLMKYYLPLYLYDNVCESAQCIGNSTIFAMVESAYI